MQAVRPTLRKTPSADRRHQIPSKLRSLRPRSDAWPSLKAERAEPPAEPGAESQGEPEAEPEAEAESEARRVAVDRTRHME